ncbi:hypothetical protein MATL_G00204330 [Megalops atlanticus]|uniref:Uncharacterized protein n=1 Tax=Megalops atlanticus TaxID=7932 RepID=A0A9D3PM32_MEGAT|nr:hypothetical protein MATL_G00204330 [Megalops atlanticus]
MTSSRAGRGESLRWRGAGPAAFQYPEAKELFLAGCAGKKPKRLEKNLHTANQIAFLKEEHHTIAELDKTSE